MLLEAVKMGRWSRGLGNIPEDPGAVRRAHIRPVSSVVQCAPYWPPQSFYSPFLQQTPL